MPFNFFLFRPEIYIFFLNMTFFRESRLLRHHGDVAYHRFAGVLDVYAFWGRPKGAHR
jgi:hypothetical protein